MLDVFNVLSCCSVLMRFFGIFEKSMAVLYASGYSLENCS